MQANMVHNWFNIEIEWFYRNGYTDFNIMYLIIRGLRYPNKQMKILLCTHILVIVGFEVCFNWKLMTLWSNKMKTFSYGVFVLPPLFFSRKNLASKDCFPLFTRIHEILCEMVHHCGDEFQLIAAACLVRPSK